jgi:hypothetical protein
MSTPAQLETFFAACFLKFESFPTLEEFHTFANSHFNEPSSTHHAINLRSQYISWLYRKHPGKAPKPARHASAASAGGTKTGGA